MKDPADYEARSNIMWTAAWALNTLVSKGKSCDWMIHMLGQAVGALTNATHGMTLSAVSLPYYRYILPYGLPKFARFAANVWGISAEGKSERALAEAGLDAMERWMKDMGLAMNITELGAAKDMLPDLVRATVILKDGYKVLDRDEIAEIFLRSF